MLVPHIWDPSFVIIAPADDLAPNGARSSAATVLTQTTKFNMYSTKFLWVLLIQNHSFSWNRKHSFSQNDIIHSGRRDHENSGCIWNIKYTEVTTHYLSLMSVFWTWARRVAIWTVPPPKYAFSKTWALDLRTTKAPAGENKTSWENCVIFHVNVGTISTSWWHAIFLHYWPFV